MKPHPLFETKKQAATSANPTLKKAIWEMYMGVGVQEAPCTLCGINRVKSNVNSGFECAHIVARNYMTEQLTVYYMFPSCATCNNECRDMCVLDFMWARGRLGPLRKVIMLIFQRYVTEHDHELSPDQRMAHLVLDNLYGPKRFPAGGGIQNTKQIYEIARAEQYQWLLEQSSHLEKKLGDLQVARQGLLEANIKPLRLE